jgi:deferrochelatase/peroxidase EfeB
MGWGSAFARYLPALDGGKTLRVSGPLETVPADTALVQVYAIVTQTLVADMRSRPGIQARLPVATCRGYEEQEGDDARLTQNWMFDAKVVSDVESVKFDEGWAYGTAIVLWFKQNGAVESHTWADWVWIDRDDRLVPDEDGRGFLNRPLGWTTQEVPQASNALGIVSRPRLPWRTDVTARTRKDAGILEQIQANILQSHVRERLQVFVLEALKSNATAACQALSQVASLSSKPIKSAQKHYNEVLTYRSRNPDRYGLLTLGFPEEDSTAFVNIGLSAAGYKALGVEPPSVPADRAFTHGMKNRTGDDALGDDLGTWEGPFEQDVLGIVVVGSAAGDEGQREVVRDEVLGVLAQGFEVNATLPAGQPPKDQDRDTEHFGFHDGISQPLYVVSDLEAEGVAADGTSVWNPLRALDQVLVPEYDAAGKPTGQYGSYLVFRKLQQHGKQFGDRVNALATFHKLSDDAELSDDDRKRQAGALLIGRFGDGTPRTMQTEAGMTSPVSNNFTYDDDEGGRMCPLTAHARVMNGRSGDVTIPLLARRGQTYASADGEDEGLYFMAVAADIPAQFERLQRTAMGLTDHCSPDFLLGRGETWAERPEVQAVLEANERSDVETILPPAITMRGGEYFFLPSIAFLQNLA